jgi:hypothetical protein
MYAMVYIREYRFTRLQRTSQVIDILSPLLIHCGEGLLC